MISRNKIWLLLCGILLVSVGSLLARGLLGMPESGIDDADIFFVYARNFADGYGFVYNAGGESVEGFTSMLWTLICSLFFSGAEPVEVPLSIFSVLLGALTVFFCLRRTERQGIFLLLAASVPGWFAWCQVTLMETGLWCLVITLLGLAVAEKRVGAVAVLLPVMILTRPESMLWGAWIVLLMPVFAESGKRLKALVYPLFSYSVSLIALIGFRLYYFGYPVPNTYYAKIAGSPMSNVFTGLHYFFGYLFSSPAVFAVLVFLSVYIVRKLISGTGEWSLSWKLAIFLVPGLGIPVLVGGDHFGGFRFYQPLWPLLCLIAALEWPNFTAQCRARLAWMALILFVIGGWVLFPFYGNLKHEFRIAAEGRDNGAALAQLFSDLESWPTVATITAGGNKYGYPGYVYDLMGLNSTEMAHAPGSRGGFKNHTGFNRDLFFAWKPDILLCGDSAEFDSLVLNGLHEQPRFSISYVKCTLHRNGAAINAWFRNEFLMSLPGTGGAIIPTQVITE